VRGFTRISEALAPEALREYINDYLTEMSTIIRRRHKGTLDKYIGDAILAALDMQNACAALNQRFRSRVWPALEIGVGVNSGRVRVGDMGSQLRRAYTAMGARQHVQEVTFREVDRVRVKGKEEAITVYEALGAGEADPEELRIWAQALRAYRSRNWDLAEVNLVNLQRMAPGRKLYQVFAERLAGARRTPMTADWDPVTVFEEK